MRLRRKRIESMGLGLAGTRTIANLLLNKEIRIVAWMVFLVLKLLKRKGVTTHLRVVLKVSGRRLTALGKRRRKCMNITL